MLHWRSTLAGLAVTLSALVSNLAAQCGSWATGGSLPGTLAVSTVGRINTSVSWDPDGAGPQAPVLVIGGSLFEVAGNVAASNVAFWNGSSWSPLGPGLSNLGAVNSLAVYNGELYAAGEFIVPVDANDPFTSAVRNVAKWTGSAWVGVGGGLNDGTPFNATSPAVRRLIVWNGSLYAIGQFSNAGGWVPPFVSGPDVPPSVPANRIARWDGTRWHPILVTLGGAVVNGFDVAGTPNDVKVINNELVIGTTMAEIGTLTAGATPLTINGAVRYNGTTWLPLTHTNGVVGISGNNANVSSIGSIGSDIVLGGTFTTAGGVVQANRIVRWNQATGFSSMGPGFSTTVIGMTEYNGRFYACTDILPANASTQYLARWNQTTSSWENIVLGQNGLTGMFGPGPGIRHLGSFGSSMVVGGSFTALNGLPTNNIALFNGTSFTALGSGTSGHIQSFVQRGSQLIASGWFTSINGVPANRVAAFNGTTWSALGTGLTGSPAAGVQPVAYASTLYNGDYVVGGDFLNAGSVVANRIARWNGTTWSTVGTGAPTNGTIRALAVYNGDLYAGGTFTIIDGVAANRVARFNGTSWQPLVSPGNTTVGGGVPATVAALFPFMGDLIVGGSFTSVTGSPVTAGRIVRWTGSDWASLGSGQLSGLSSGIPVQAMTVFEDKLVVGGTFTIADGTPLGSTANDGQIVAFDPATSQWSNFGAGFQGIVNSLHVFNGRLLVGGSIGPDFNADPALFGGLVQWNPSTQTFTQFGGGFRGAAFALATFNNVLFAGGHITSVGVNGSTVSPFLARWTTTGLPTISVQPLDQSVSVGDSASFSVAATATSSLSFQWQRQVAPGLWRSLANGSDPVLGQVAGANASQLQISNSFAGTTLLRCLVETPCSGRFTRETTLVSSAGCGPADLGGEGAAEMADGILDNNDFIVFINYFFALDSRADLGGEGGAEGADGQFDNNDFIVFIGFFFQGC